MGNHSSVDKAESQGVPGIFEHADEAVGRFQGDVHMLVCALDYKKTAHPLTCTVDGRNMLELAHQSNVSDVVSLFDEAATVKNVQKKVKQIGSRCKAGDCFIFFYAGHGHYLADQDGDEDDGEDEMLCFVDERGSLDRKNWMRDDDFAKMMTSNIPKETTVLIIADCCHSGTIADFGRPEWEGYQAACLSGCTDSQTSGDTGRGGILTHSILMGIQKFNRLHNKGYSIGALFRKVVEMDDSTFNSPQIINIHVTPGTDCEIMPWPCVPPSTYLAPWKRARGRSRHGQIKHVAPCSDGKEFSKAHPQGFAESSSHPVVHVLICALDYKKTPHPLTCTIDGRNMLELAQQSSAEDVVTLFDEEVILPNVKEQIRSMGSRCKPGDYFVFFFAGHGVNLVDDDGDENDGKDEAFVLVDQNGQIGSENMLRDDKFAEIMTSSIPRGTNILIISDCCHSGTIADFNRCDWHGHRAISLSGCKDLQTSGDTGRGGIFTHSMLMAVEKLSECYHHGFSVGALFCAALEKDDAVFHSHQDLTIQSCSGTSYDGMAWPLVPKPPYIAPMNRKKPEELVAPSVGSLPEHAPLPVLLSTAGDQAICAKPDKAMGEQVMEVPVVKGNCAGCLGVLGKKGKGQRTG